MSLAPQTFTQCMDAALTPMRQQGLRMLKYFDDWLVCATSKEHTVMWLCCRSTIRIWVYA